MLLTIIQKNTPGITSDLGDGVAFYGGYVAYVSFGGGLSIGRTFDL